MNNDDLDELTMGHMSNKPIQFTPLMRRVLLVSFGCRAVGRSLQRLRKQGRIRYLHKADGGPGWVRA